jgi:hypothetical protein
MSFHIGERVIVDNLSTICKEKYRGRELCPNGFPEPGGCVGQHGIIEEICSYGGFRIKMDKRNYDINSYVCRLDGCELRKENTKELI